MSVIGDNYDPGALPQDTPTLEAMRSELRAAQREAVELREKLDILEQIRTERWVEDRHERARDLVKIAALEGELERAYAAIGRDYIERLRLRGADE